MPIEFVPITIPAVLIVAVAVRLARQSGGQQEETDVVLDLRDVPTVRLARPAPVGQPLSAVTGALVAPGEVGSLGARLRSVETPVFAEVAAVSRPTAPRGRVVVGRRRRQPLVAQR
jgi:hypothetical protein